MRKLRMLKSDITIEDFTNGVNTDLLIKLHNNLSKITYNPPAKITLLKNSFAIAIALNEVYIAYFNSGLTEDRFIDYFEEIENKDIRLALRVLISKGKQIHINVYDLKELYTIGEDLK